MPYRFVHAADIHLDSPLRSLAMRDPRLAELIGNATRQAFMRIIDLCLDESVNALLIAGDLYDGDQTSMKTARFLAEQFGRLNEAGIAVFIIRGNHDALSRITRQLTLPDRVKTFSGRAEAFRIDRDPTELPVFIHGLSFSEPQAPESLLGKYRPPVDGAINIGLMHTSLGGAIGHDPYAPCSLADLQSSGFNYWALGHIHSRSVYSGACTVVMPGIPQGRDINESGAKSCSLVTILDDRSIHVEEHVTSIAQFERRQIDVSRCGSWADVIRAIGLALRDHRSKARSAHVVVRLSISGITPLAWRLRRDADLLQAEAELLASTIDGLWIEAVDIVCGEIHIQSAGELNVVNELHRLIGADIFDSPVYRQAVAEIASELSASLPPEARKLFGSDEESFRAILAELASQGTDDVLARLRAKDEGGQA